ncbi:MAG: oligosaccharide flippase family protein [Deltaproteobacteria bacterium]|nr:oligosaccharide flippase family protein [Deltaproteobacteria bacterium]
MSGETIEASEAQAGDARSSFDLRRLALRGSLWTIGGHLFNNAARFASNLILTRLLVPDHFGVMTVANVFLQGLYMLSDLGLGPSIIQNKRGEEEGFLNTAWTIQVIRGAILFAIACVLGGPLARFYEMPDLAWLFPLLGTTALIDGFTSTAVFTLNRALMLGRLILLDSMVTLTAITTNLITALVAPSILALALGGVTGALMRMLLSHWFLPGIRHRFALEREARAELLRFGRWILLSTGFTFLALQIDRLVLGKLVSEAELGVYSIAFMLAVIPREVMDQLAQRVYYPVVARELRNDPSSPSVRRLRAHLMLLVLVPIACTMGVAVSLVAFLYDERYALAGPLMAWLSLGTWFNIAEATYGAMALARGEPRWITYGTGLKVVVFALAISVVRGWSVEGIAMLTALSTLAIWLFTAVAAWRYRLASLGVDVLGTLALLVIAYLVHQLEQFISGVAGYRLVGLAFVGLIAVGVPAFLLRKRVLVLL